MIAKFGVPPASIPDYLGLVGDSADGFPGIPGGAPRPRPPCSPATATSRRSPTRPGSGTSPGCVARPSCPHALRADFELALLFRRIATVETDVDVGTVDDWQWTGPTPEFAEIAERLDEPNLIRRAEALAAKR